MKKRMPAVPPVDSNRIVLHSCCAPCSSALVEHLVERNIIPILFYYNPNIYPLEEYEIRKEENKRYAQALGLKFVDADYDHRNWKRKTLEYRHEPEGGLRCARCFYIRMLETAKFTAKIGYEMFATTLATSRWKNIEQVNTAGEEAALQYPGVVFWANNWRKGGLSERRAALIKEHNFYLQNYCGCEYSMGNTASGCRSCKLEAQSCQQ